MKYRIRKCYTVPDFYKQYQSSKPLLNFRFPLKQNRSAMISFHILTTAFPQKVAQNLSAIPQVSDHQAAVETKTPKQGALIMVPLQQNHQRVMKKKNLSIPARAKETHLQ